MSATRTMWQIVRPAWPLALAAFVANLLSALFEGSTIGILAVAFQVLGDPSGDAWKASLGLVGEWIQSVRLSGHRDMLFLGLVLAAVVAQVLRSGFQFAGDALTAHVQVRVHTQSYGRIFARLMRRPFAQISSSPLGQLTEDLNRSGSLFELCYRLNVLIRSAFFVTIYVVVLCWLSWPLTLAVLVASWMVSGLFRWIMGTVRRLAGHDLEATLALSQRVTEWLAAARLIHTFGRQDATIRAADQLVRERMASRCKAVIWSGAIEPLTDILSVIGIGVFLLGGYLVLAPRGLVALPALLAFLLALYRVTPRVRSIQSSLAGLAALTPSLQRLCELLELGADRPRSEQRPCPRLREAIAFRHVTFRYLPEEPPALIDFSVRIPHGRFVAIVGSSGAGKSTLADLLLGLFEPTAGQILVDGGDLRTLDPVSWRMHLGVVSQDPFLFHASIKENIAYGKPTATMEEIVEAARAAHAEEFIAQLANDYDTVVGERGVRLSGGQRQRIALARALVRQPLLLILDEATSALDSESELYIQRALDEQRGTRTILAIAHRLSTIAHADQILVVAEGKLMEQGTHQKLLAREGIYARLWRLQSGQQDQQAPAALGARSA